MLKIGEFSKLSHTTVKALRFYEKEGLLTPASVDEWTGYRFYETSQLGISIDEIKHIFSGEDVKKILQDRKNNLQAIQRETELRISVIEFIMEKNIMKYQVTEKNIPEMIICSSETTLEKYDDAMQWIPSVGEECLRLNPDMKCAGTPYEFCEYLDGEYKETNVRIRHNEAVACFGKENGHIKFKTLPAAKVLSIYHIGPYNTIGEAYAFLIDYAEKNGYEINGLARECYIDGIWNKESVNDWLTEVQLPIK